MEESQALTSHLEQPSGSVTEVENGGATVDYVVLLLNLKQFEDGAHLSPRF